MITLNLVNKLIFIVRKVKFVIFGLCQSLICVKMTGLIQFLRTSKIRAIVDRQMFFMIAVVVFILSLVSKLSHSNIIYLE